MTRIMRAIDTSPQISLDTINTLLLRYNDNVPAKIQELEKLRVDMIPETLTQRKKDGKPYLDKAEVTGLVEWKLCVSSTPSILRTYSKNIKLSLKS